MSITIKNRREAYHSIMPKRDNRKQLIQTILQNGDSAGMTAEEIAQKLVETGQVSRMDMNFVRPRLTEMKEDGLVRVVGRRPSAATGRNTSVWKLVKRQETSLPANGGK